MFIKLLTGLCSVESQAQARNDVRPNGKHRPRRKPGEGQLQGQSPSVILHEIYKDFKSYFVSLLLFFLSLTSVIIEICELLLVTVVVQDNSISGMDIDLFLCFFFVF
jgi:hypothetical protein